MNQQNNTTPKALCPPVVFPFIKWELGAVKTVAVLSLQTAVPHKAPLVAVGRALTDWVAGTMAGQRACDLSGGELNIGDLHREHAFDDPDLVRMLEARGLHNVHILGLTTEGAVPFDAALAEGPPGEHADETSGSEERGQEAIQRYTLYTAPDGSITGTTWTNDNFDRGFPNESASWEVSYRDRADMEARTGKTHFGVSGVRVEVFLDGEPV